MKKRNFMLSALLLTVIVTAKSQISVDCDGKVGVGNATPQRLFTVGGANNTPIIGFKTADALGWATYTKGNQDFCIYEYTNTAWTTGYQRFTIKRGGNVGIGIAPGAHKLTVNGNFRLYGDFSFSNNTLFSSSGFNVLELDDVSYSDNHVVIGYDGNWQTGIYTSYDGDGSIGTPNKQWYEMHAYAYFSHSSPITSDKRLKKNIHNFSGALSMVNAMEPKQYDRKVDDRIKKIDDKMAALRAKTDKTEPADSATQNDSIKIARANAKEKALEALTRKKEELIKCSKNQYGFIAQELQKVVPEAVIYKKDIDRYYVDYNMVVPILAAAMKEQQGLIDSLAQQVNVNTERLGQLEQQFAIKGIPGVLSPNNLKSAQQGENLIEQTNSTLAQNTPNPFNQSTQINYYLAGATVSATLYIYNMNGAQLKSIELHQTGNGSITINAGEFEAGMYMYTLVANGQVVGTKQMILTE